MFALSFWAVEGLLCLPLALLVWSTQHLLNTFHPSAAFRQAHRVALPGIARFLLLLVLGAGAAVCTTCLFGVYAITVQGWQALWTLSMLHLVIGSGILVSSGLIFGSATLSMRHWQRTHASLKQEGQDGERADETRYGGRVGRHKRLP